jgi:response regulator of citrate/malate metabolism
MKKATMTAIVNYLTENLPYADESEKEFLQSTIDELNAELAKGKAKADANREAYAEIHDKVVEALTGITTPVTAQDIADETGIARGKIVYGLKNYWASEVVVDTTGKVNTYRLA